MTDNEEVLLGYLQKFYPDRDVDEIADIIDKLEDLDLTNEEVEHKLYEALREARESGEKPFWVDDDQWNPEDPDWQFFDQDLPPNQQYFEDIDNPRSSDKCIIDKEKRTYYFRLKDYEDVEATFEQIEELIRYYVHKGAGKTQNACCRYASTQDFAKKTGGTLQLQHGQYKRMLKAIDIVKDSLPFAPHEYDEKEASKLADEWRSQDEAMVEQRYLKNEPKHWKKLYTKERKKSLQAKNFADMVADSVEKFEPEPIDIRPRLEDVEPVDIIVLISDWHLGKVIDTEYNQFNRVVFRDRIRRLKENIIDHFNVNLQPIDHLHIVSVGDMVDGPMGNMHPEQGINQDLHGSDQVVTCAQAFADVIQFVARSLDVDGTSVHTVSGNHDRVSSHRDYDPGRFAGQLVYELAKSYCKDDDIEWNICEGIIGSFRAKNTQVLFTHGDRTPKRTRDVIWTHQDKNADDYLLLCGHRHSLELKEDKDILFVQGGSLCGADDYAMDRLGKGGKPSQVIIDIKESGPRPAKWVLVE